MGDTDCSSPCPECLVSYVGPGLFVILFTSIIFAEGFVLTTRRTWLTKLRMYFSFAFVISGIIIEGYLTNVLSLQGSQYFCIGALALMDASATYFCNIANALPKTMHSCLECATLCLFGVLFSIYPDDTNDLFSGMHTIVGQGFYLASFIHVFHTVYPVKVLLHIDYVLGFTSGLVYNYIGMAYYSQDDFTTGWLGCNMDSVSEMEANMAIALILLWNFITAMMLVTLGILLFQFVKRPPELMVPDEQFDDLKFGMSSFGMSGYKQIPDTPFVGEEIMFT
mmetsp:Transcript_4081/g.5674  ORF Transcript_4081/g.5674 Transcript_4081/m.5674 type:complete len:280 (+) Transcript_4081:75-914(+)